MIFNCANHLSKQGCLSLWLSPHKKGKKEYPIRVLREQLVIEMASPLVELHACSVLSFWYLLAGETQ